MLLLQGKTPGATKIEAPEGKKCYQHVFVSAKDQAGLADR
jgi:hypothetical protein